MVWNQTTVKRIKLFDLGKQNHLNKNTDISLSEMGEETYQAQD